MHWVEQWTTGCMLTSLHTVCNVRCKSNNTRCDVGVSVEWARTLDWTTSALSLHVIIIGDVTSLYTQRSDLSSARLLFRRSVESDWVYLQLYCGNHYLIHCHESRPPHIVCVRQISFDITIVYTGWAKKFKQLWFVLLLQPFKRNKTDFTKMFPEITKIKTRLQFPCSC